MLILARLSRRERIPERMDDPGLDPAEHRRALAELARINRLSGSARILWPPLRDLAREYRGQAIRVLDVACGSGDVTLALAAKARRSGLANLSLDGCDISPVAIEAATERARESACESHFFLHDAIREPLPSGYDAVICSLFLHHLPGDDAVTLLGRMKEAAARLVLVNDLERSRFNFAAVWLVSQFGSRIVRFDGPASVRSAFTPREALELAEQAGLDGARADRRFPCRYLLSWRRP
jgi:SAM-dependent methyltransferase